MYKIFIFILSFFLIQTVVSAQPDKEIDFLYINGANNNTAKTEEWYFNGVSKLHPIMKKAFEDNEIVKEHFLKNGEYKIAENPLIYFWGDKSARDLTFMEQNLAITKGVSPWLAFNIRWMIATILHDAIWVQKYHNMKIILDEINDKLKAEAELGRQAVLFGYSAGSFVSYQYLFHKLRYIDMTALIKYSNVEPEAKEFIYKNPSAKTCLDALSTADLAVLTLDGDIFPKDDLTNFKENYLKLDSISADVCAPDGKIRGIVNYASPIPLFYSDLADPSYKFTFFNIAMYRYLVENDMFWLTVNYREDPLGFPNTRNLKPDEFEKILNLDITGNNGFVYDNSGVWGKRTCFTAHTAYWTTRKTFAKAVAKAYEKGWKNYYAEENIVD